MLRRIYPLALCSILLVILVFSCSKNDSPGVKSDSNSPAIKSNSNKILINTIKGETTVSYRGKKIDVATTNLKSIGSEIKKISTSADGIDTFTISVLIKDKASPSKSKRGKLLSQSFTGVEDGEISNGTRIPFSFEFGAGATYNTATLEWTGIVPHSAYVLPIPPSQTYTDVYYRTIYEEVQILDPVAVPTSPLPSMAMEVTWTYSIQYWRSIDGSPIESVYPEPQTRTFTGIF
ncbi:hypothetical protein [Niabella sp.]|uniref:hypothetical protein n=1 Tax=Niabella sp. TaxID=1962976 RepID=UPI002636E34A|nr:hypothetical protein [Niabella sp.]